jgi:hypothetical protein
LRVFADAAHNAVPTAVARRVGTVAGKGETATPAMEVKTTRNVSLDLDSWVYIFGKVEAVRAGEGRYAESGTGGELN